MRVVRCSFLATLGLGVVAASACAVKPVRECEVRADCSGGLLCVASRCVPPMSAIDGGELDSSGDALRPGGDASLDAWPPLDTSPPVDSSCPSRVVCGTPAVCCAMGQDCLDNRCVAACASGVRCGADSLSCCSDGQACVSGLCVAPSGTCTDSFECEVGDFCEPVFGRCLRQFSPVMCRTTPMFGPFETRLEWSMTDASVAPDCVHAIAPPVVIDLDGDRIPEVVINTHCDDEYTHAVLRALRGDTGAPVWTQVAPPLNGRVQIAAGNILGDARPEIVAVSQPPTSNVVAFDSAGAVLWRAREADDSLVSLSNFDNGAVTLADLDMDGNVEVILGALVLDNTGRVRWRADTAQAEGSNDGYMGGVSAVADVDLDGMPEVITGRHAYNHDGSRAWEAMTPDGYPAIAQFDSDPQPEVVLVAMGSVYLLDGRTGAIEWGPIVQPGGGRGGPPTVADFDGDGAPEIGVAGAGSYAVYDPRETESVRWSRTTLDISSNATGSSVFDFEGDGRAEVAYGDECYTRVYSGLDGNVLFEVDSSSATIHEFPVIADVDGDGNTEMIIVANNRRRDEGMKCRMSDPTWDGDRHGVFVYGDARDQWMRTRRVWNQHTYHVTNVDVEGAIPRSESNNWTIAGLNNYRQNVQGEGVYNAPDLAVLGFDVNLDACPTSVMLRARVTNVGTLGVAAGVSVAFYFGTRDARGALIGVGRTTMPLLPGGSAVVSVRAMLTTSPPYSFVAVVDDDGTGAGTVIECNEGDNAEAIGGVDCQVLL